MVILWPYDELSFRFDAGELLEHYVDGTEPMSMAEMHRSLALRIKRDWVNNGRLLRRIREALQLALELLLFQIVTYFLSIAGEAIQSTSGKICNIEGISAAGNTTSDHRDACGGGELWPTVSAGGGHADRRPSRQPARLTSCESSSSARARR
jgi:hypothetical protein